MATNYTARFQLPDLLERGRSNTITADIYLNGAAVTVTSGDVEIYDKNNTLVESSSFVGSATYTFTPASTLTLGVGWRIEWTLVISGGTYVFRNEAALVRNRLYPVITDADLFRRVSSLDPSNTTTTLSSVSDYQDYIDEAWNILNSKLIAMGNRPNLITTPSSLRESHLLLTLTLIFEDFSTRLSGGDSAGDQYSEAAMSYREQYADAWNGIRFEYDLDDDGQSDGNVRRPRTSVVWI